MKRLILSRPFLRRVPDQTIIASGVGTRGDYKTAVRAHDRSYEMVYAPTQQTFTISMNKLSGAINAWWYNPRNGSCYNANAAITTAPFAQYTSDETVEFTPPSDNPDWVLVLDDAARGFSVPGQ